mmetsp:Transcript_29518/g.94632  ORF Transcript_29518/g.94632 Transcript_29518/m.94632 type:complete len:255 (-) Transcript_29518:532-1296(-)
MGEEPGEERPGAGGILPAIGDGAGDVEHEAVEEMILQILSHPRGGNLDLYPVLLQLLLLPDPGQHQELRSMHGTRCQQNLLPPLHVHVLPVLPSEPHSLGLALLLSPSLLPAAVDLDLEDRSSYDHLQVPPPHRRTQVSPAHAPPPPPVRRALQMRTSLLLLPVVVRILSQPRRCTSFHERCCQGTPLHGVGDEQGAMNAMVARPAKVLVVLSLLEVAQGGRVVPARRSPSLPLVEVLRVSSHVRHVVDRAPSS